MWSSINNWIKPFLNEYHKNNISVTIVCNMDSGYESDLKSEFPFISTFPVPFPRGMSFIGSLKSIAILKRFFKKERFDLVQYSTPNASFYASIAAKEARIPIRLYCQWGMVYVTMSGFKRIIFKNIERTVCRLSTNVQPDSIGNLEFCRSQGFYNEKKSEVIWYGSAKGLDLSVFDVTKKTEYNRIIRNKYDIPFDAPVIGFVGRLGREKGCHELFRAFKEIKSSFPTARLLFVGPIEKEETIDSELLEYFRSCDDIIKIDRVSHVEQYMSAMDVFVLPSYREGFGMSVIEAEAMEVPVIVTKYPGPAGAMVDQVNGFAIDIYDVEAIVKNVIFLLDNPDVSSRFGQNGREYVETHFDQVVFKEKYINNRLALLK